MFCFSLHLLCVCGVLVLSYIVCVVLVFTDCICGVLVLIYFVCCGVFIRVELMYICCFKC